jgi:uncharacterized membrane protein YjfL (UPF0719 family)
MKNELFGIYLWQLKQYIFHDLPLGFAYFAIALLLLFLAKLTRDFATRGIDDDAEITKKDNIAFGLFTAGYYLGVGLAFIGVFLGPDAPFLQSAADLFLYGITGIVLMGMSYVITDLAYLRKFGAMKELLAENTAVGLFLMGRFLYTGLNVLAAIHGDGSWFVTFVYFILGEIGCWLGFRLYCLVTPYDDIGAIKENNQAVGLASGGFVVSMGLLTLNALWGDFLGYDIMLLNFGAWFLGGTILLLLFRTLGARILFPKSSLQQEIHKDNNRGAAAIMFATYLIIATVIILSF